MSSQKNHKTSTARRVFSKLRIGKFKAKPFDLTPQERNQLMKNPAYIKALAEASASPNKNYSDSPFQIGRSLDRFSLFDKTNILFMILGVGFSTIFYIIDAKTSEFSAKLETSQTQILSEIKDLKLQVQSYEKNTDYKLQIQRLEIEKEMPRR